MAYPLLVFLRLLPAHASGQLNVGRLLLKVTLCSICLMASDLILDPLSVLMGVWRWPDGGAYYCP